MATDTAATGGDRFAARAEEVAAPFAGRLGADLHGELVASIAAALAAPAGECCIPLPGEPGFVLLGRDPQAPDLVEAWARVRADAEPASPKPEAARRIAERMRSWKALHPEIGMSAGRLDGRCVNVTSTT